MGSAFVGKSRLVSLRSKNSTAAVDGEEPGPMRAEVAHLGLSVAKQLIYFVRQNSGITRQLKRTILE